MSDFYRGRTITLLIGSSPGGGYDTYGRLVARHIGKYIPGQPQVVPSNMPGAGGNVVAGYAYNVAPKDGTVMALVLPGTITEPLFKGRDKVKHDPAKLTYLGSANSEVNMCYLRSDTGVSSVKDLQTKEVVIGASAEGARPATSRCSSAISSAAGSRWSAAIPARAKFSWPSRRAR